MGCKGSTMFYKHDVIYYCGVSRTIFSHSSKEGISSRPMIFPVRRAMGRRMIKGGPDPVGGCRLNRPPLPRGRPPNYTNPFNSHLYQQPPSSLTIPYLPWLKDFAFR